MFISVILNVEYMDMSSRKMWYLKNLLHCKENGWILITHDYIRKHFEELQDSITDRLLDQFEMRKFSWEEAKEVEQYYIADEVFEKYEKDCGSRTQTLLESNESNYQDLDEALAAILETIKKKHPFEKIEGVFHCLEGFNSLRTFANKCNCPFIVYSFSAFRKPHGYRQTLYTTNTKGFYWSSKEFKARFNNYLNENNKDIPVFTNEELIAIIGKEHTLPLIKLIDNEPKYEMGVCCECFAMVPQAFRNNIYTDDDILFECHKLFGRDKIKVRSHSVHLDDIQVDRNYIHNDPASTILSCKRVSAVLSQIMLKVGLWKRVAVMKKEATAFSYLCEKDFMSSKVVDITGLNYYLFGFLIPQELMFSDSYWKWRLTSPSESEIYMKHLQHIFDKLEIPVEILSQTESKERFCSFLRARNCDEQLISILTDDSKVFNIDWDAATSRFEINTNGKTKKYWRINEIDEKGCLSTVLEVKHANTKSFDFYPLDDIAGFAKINSLRVNDITINVSNKIMYMAKVTGHYHIELPQRIKNIIIECNWELSNFDEYQSQYV